MERIRSRVPRKTGKFYLVPVVMVECGTFQGDLLKMDGLGRRSEIHSFIHVEPILVVRSHLTQHLNESLQVPSRLAQLRSHGIDQNAHRYFTAST